jgi:nitroreductase
MSSNPSTALPENADFEFPVDQLIAKRRSGRAFSSKPVDAATLGSLLEAARWAASCSNEQPWIFIVTKNVTGKDEPSGHDRMLKCLVDFNIQWARHAPVLILSVARLNFSASGKPNRHALYDLGQAAGNLALQATALGLMAHQMAGFDGEKARSEFRIPAGYEPASVIAVGYPGDPASLPDKLRERDLAPRQRKPQHDFVFSDTWGKPLL